MALAGDQQHVAAAQVRGSQVIQGKEAELSERAVAARDVLERMQQEGF